MKIESSHNLSLFEEFLDRPKVSIERKRGVLLGLSFLQLISVEEWRKLTFSLGAPKEYTSLIVGKFNELPTSVQEEIKKTLDNLCVWEIE